MSVLVITAQQLFSAAARRPRAHSQAVFRPLAPVLPATPARRTLATLNTPPPHAANIERLKAKGAFTDPACARRRPAFPQTDLFDIEEGDYAPYPAAFGASPLAGLARADPFDATPGFASFDDHVRRLSGLPDSPPPPQRQQQAAQPSACPVCGNHASKLVALAPCAHVLCSACFTSSLNIVGEKNMECAVCRMAVESFEMRAASVVDGAGKGFEAPQQVQQQPRRQQVRVMSGAGSVGGIGTGTGTVLRIDNVPWVRARSSGLLSAVADSCVPASFLLVSLLRPGCRRHRRSSWRAAHVHDHANNRFFARALQDITPPMMTAWLKQPVRRVHILLDRKGKTQSHAFVEMHDEDGARAALRGAQNSVLGRGKVRFVSFGHCLFVVFFSLFARCMHRVRVAQRRVRARVARRVAVFVVCAGADRCLFSLDSPPLLPRVTPVRLPSRTNCNTPPYAVSIHVYDNSARAA
jgi:hypothetical protein